LAYPGKQRTPDEQPLRRRDLAVLRTLFARVEMNGHQLFSMVRRVLPRMRLVRGLERFDDGLLRLIPPLQGFCRYMVLTLWR
jgi:hypothetical protein